jgi:hypothetical protein
MDSLSKCTVECSCTSMLFWPWKNGPSELVEVKDQAQNEAFCVDATAEVFILSLVTLFGYDSEEQLRGKP